jgi:hypothetical protein
MTGKVKEKRINFNGKMKQGVHMKLYVDFETYV